MECVQHFLAMCKTFWLTWDRRYNFFEPFSAQGERLSDCIVSVLCGQHGIWRITHLVFGERTRKGRSPQYLIKGEILPLQKASTKQICFALPNLDAFLLIKDRVRRATSPQPLVQSSLICAPTSYHMMVTANMLFFSPHKMCLQYHATIFCVSDSPHITRTWENDTRVKTRVISLQLLVFFLQSRSKLLLSQS